PYLQAMWPTGLESRHQEPLCEYLRVEVPNRPSMFNPLENEEFQESAQAWFEAEAQGGESVEEERPKDVGSKGKSVAENAEEFTEEDIEFDDKWVAEPLVNKPSVGKQIEELFEAIENRP